MRTHHLPRDEVERRARELVRSAARTPDIASPPVEAFPLERLRSEALPCSGAGELPVRLEFQVAGDHDVRRGYPDLEVTIRSLDGCVALDVDCADAALAERVHEAVVGVRAEAAP
ncbi:MAG: hypothetical protein KatS3mg012_1166 [Gaiellaceae bacterium]|nr:MAG: hypothetical protein KatS3mg012_1166 [Gaiellaceae bacterium]